ncbi:MAG: DUF5060 domain-containing protein [Planctomycetota bacterium]
MASSRQLVLALIVALASALPVHAAGYVYPGTDWQTATPESVGMDAALLQAALSSLNGNVMVVRNGYLVGQANGIDQETLLYSVSKSLTALVFGCLLQSGQASLDDLVPYSDNPGAPLASYRQFLSMTSDYGLSPHSPGNYYAYNNKAVHHSGWAMQPYFGGQAPDAILDQALFSVTGRQDPIDFRGLWSGWGGGFTLSARDCARLGYLVLRDGVWESQQVIPASFVSALHSNQVPTGGAANWSIGAPPTEGVDGDNWWNQYHLTSILPGNYSFGWWTNQNGLHPGLPADLIWASGLGGHLIVVCPSYDLLVCVISGGDLQSLDTVMPPILAAVLPASREHEAGTWGMGEVTGEQRAWHKVSVTFDGLPTSELATINPFRDYRLDVTFSKGGRSFVVPGHFAADGNAAESGANAGSKWRVHFTPDEAGVWSYQASFRTGQNVAIDSNPLAGVPTQFHGARGSFTVAHSDKTGRDFRGKGMLQYVGERYLRFAGNGEPFLKGGADSPENFLAYSGFDQTPNSHYYAPHAGDWRTGDLDWKNGQGRNIIGALNYLADVGMNSVYFLTMNVNGDGNDVWPWISMAVLDRYDCSKLDQWELVFEQMDRLGILLHVVTQETENDHLLDTGTLGVERKLYYRELVSRFGHHLALVWNLGEENSNDDLERKQFADHLRALDPYDHAITVHTEIDAQQAVYGSLLGYPSIESASLQLGQVNETQDETLTWVAASAAAGRPWVVCLDEIGPSSVGVVPDSIDPEHDEVRREGLWGNLMAGGGGVEWYFGYLYANDDLTCENWRSRDAMWRLTGLALDFFRTYLPFWEMTPADQLVSIPEAHCLARAGDVLAVYLPHGGSPGINMTYFPGIYSIEWLDPRNGGALQVAGTRFVLGGSWTSVGSPPSSPVDDWVLLLRSVDSSQQLYGAGVAGYGGLTPFILANAGFVGNPTFRIFLSGARPQAASMIVLGNRPVSVPVFGGLLLNNAALGYHQLGTDAAGKAYDGLPLPKSPSLAGRDLYFQWFISDPAAVGGVAMSRGLQVTLYGQ